MIDAFLMTTGRRILMESRLLPLRLVGRDLSWILRHLDGEKSGPPGPHRNPAPQSLVDQIEFEVWRATKRPWAMRNRRCLRQAILCYRALRREGYQPVMHFSVSPGSIDTQSLAAHCWVEIDGRPLCSGNQPEYVPILTHPTVDATVGLTGLHL